MKPLWQARLDLQLFRLTLADRPELFDDPAVRILYRNCLTDYRRAKAKAKRINKVKIVTTKPPKPKAESPYLTAKEAAGYLGLAYSTFRKRRKFIKIVPQTGRFRREDLEAYAESLKPKRQKR